VFDGHAIPESLGNECDFTCRSNFDAKLSCPYNRACSEHLIPLHHNKAYMIFCTLDDISTYIRTNAETFYINLRFAFIFAHDGNSAKSLEVSLQERIVYLVFLSAIADDISGHFGRDENTLTTV
jgi:hypothetical protein